jgi:hypothetical protein
MRLPTYALFVALVFSFFQSKTQEHAASTATSRLTDDDACILLYVTPYAVEARKAGSDVDIEKSGPTKGYPVADYFVAALVSRKPSLGVLGNGIIGYFAVDKRNGTVESMADFTPVNGMELRRVQNWMRHARGMENPSSKQQ